MGNVIDKFIECKVCQGSQSPSPQRELHYKREIETGDRYKTSSKQQNNKEKLHVQSTSDDKFQKNELPVLDPAGDSCEYPEIPSDSPTHTLPFTNPLLSSKNVSKEETDIHPERVDVIRQKYSNGDLSAHYDINASDDDHQGVDTDFSDLSEDTRAELLQRQPDFTKGNP